MNPLLPAGALLAGLWWLIWRRFPAPTWLQRQAQAQILEILLYADLPAVLARVLADLVRTNLRLLLALLPASLLALAVTLAAWLGLRGFCNWRPPLAGERLLLSARSEAGQQLRLDQGVRLDSQPLRTGPSIYWRIVAERPGNYQVWLEGQRPARLTVGPGWAYLQPDLAGLTIHYPPRDFWLRDRKVNWTLGLGLSCLAWTLGGLVFKSCWLFLVRQDARSSSRNKQNGRVFRSAAAG